MKTLQERFEDKIFYSPDGCWYWTGTLSCGYGLISVIESNGRRARKASRVSYTLYKGEITNGLNVCHSCDNPPCVNPDHLFLGTQKDNMQDCVKKGRFVPPKPIGGVIKPRFKYIGEKFGLLTVIAYAEYRNRWHYWLCRCECGNESKVTSSALRAGRIRSCGCLKMKNLRLKKLLSI